jgi:AhpC/TSA family
MALKETLDATRTAAVARRGPEIRAIMDRATADLRSSDILKKIMAVGQKAPSFSAPNYDGTIISSTELLASRPLVLSFFRGAW